jgi:hypothetical protein
VPFLFGEELGAEVAKGGVTEVSSGELVNEGLGVGAALAELDLDEDLARGALKAGPARRRAPSAGSWGP